MRLSHEAEEARSFHLSVHQLRQLKRVAGREGVVIEKLFTNLVDEILLDAETHGVFKVGKRYRVFVDQKEKS